MNIKTWLNYFQPGPRARVGKINTQANMKSNRFVETISGRKEKLEFRPPSPRPSPQGEGDPLWKSRVRDESPAQSNIGCAGDFSRESDDFYKAKANNYSRWMLVVIFAVAMAWVESAVVYYLRVMIDRIQPYQTNPLPIIDGMGSVEMIREMATMVMLFAVGALAGRNWRARFGYAAIAFGVWDIFYYIFLKVICGWPHSLGDWDLLFLLPLPWWGPVWAPMAIALLMIAWGTLASQFEQADSVRQLRRLWLLNFLASSSRCMCSWRIAFTRVTAARAPFGWCCRNISIRRSFVVRSC